MYSNSILRVRHFAFVLCAPIRELVCDEVPHEYEVLPQLRYLGHAAGVKPCIDSVGYFVCVWLVKVPCTNTLMMEQLSA